jgi:hypothetical protein
MPGNYGEFEIDRHGNIVQPGNDSGHGYYFAQSFIYQYTGNIDKIEQLVRRYARDYGADISISVYTDRGEKLLSWMY